MSAKKAKQQRRDKRAAKSKATLASLRFVEEHGERWVSAGDGVLLSLPQYAVLRRANPQIAFPSFSELEARSSAQ